MYNQHIVDLEEQSYQFGLVLCQFKNQWYEYCFNMFQWPTMGYDKITEEFIIQVPHNNLKVQYVLFIYI